MHALVESDYKVFMFCSCTYGVVHSAYIYIHYSMDHYIDIGGYFYAKLRDTFKRKWRQARGRG